MSRRHRKHSTDELKLMARAMEQCGEAIVLTDAAYRLIYANPAFWELFGYSAEELGGRNISTLMPHPENTGAPAATSNCGALPASFHGETHWHAKNGQDVPILLDVSPLKADSGECLGFVASMLRTEDRLPLAASIFQSAYDGVIITDAAATILDVNPAFTRLTGYEREEVIGKNPRLLQSGRQGREFYAALWEQLLLSGYFRGEVWNRRKDGTEYAELLTIFAVRDGAGATRQYLGIFNDITPIKKQTTELERLAHFDPLTGLPNRLLLADRLTQAIAQARRTQKSFAVCFLDLDGFKAINDTYGHAVGDEVLIEVARRVSQCVREGDTLARLGGDEFVLLLTHLDDRQDCERTLRRVIAFAAEPIAMGGLNLYVSLSIGVTLFPRDGEDPDTLVRRADQSMYVAKQTGKNRYRFFSEP